MRISDWSSDVCSSDLVHDFLRAYYHHKSADWKANRPFPLKAWTAEDLAQLPTYYVMDRDRTMPETVAAEMPPAAEIGACSWLNEPELGVYNREYDRNGFQGGPHWYPCRTSVRSEHATLTVTGRESRVAGSAE